jgi:hypothetical protein
MFAKGVHGPKKMGAAPRPTSLSHQKTRAKTTDSLLRHTPQGRLNVILVQTSLFLRGCIDGDAVWCCGFMILYFYRAPGKVQWYSTFKLLSL